MLDDANKDTVPNFEYIADPYEKYYFNLARSYSNAYGWDFPCDDDIWNYGGYNYPAAKHKCQCVKCHKIYDDSDVFPVKAKDRKGVHYYCVDCVGTGINWCKKCGEPFEVEHETDEICFDCAEKEKSVIINT